MKKYDGCVPMHKGLATGKSYKQATDDLVGAGKAKKEYSRKGRSKDADSDYDNDKGGYDPDKSYD